MEPTPEQIQDRKIDEMMRSEVAVGSNPQRPRILDHPRIAAAWGNVMDAFRAYEQTLVDVLNEPQHESPPIYEGKILDVYQAEDLGTYVPPDARIAILVDVDRPDVLMSGGRVVVYSREDLWKPPGK